MKNGLRKITLALGVAFLLGFVLHFLQTEKIPPLHFEGGRLLLSPHILSLIESLRAFIWGYARPLLSLYILLIGTLIFLEGRNPDRTILWLLVLGFVPGLGLLLYILLGPDLRRLRSRKKFDLSRAFVGAQQSPQQAQLVDRLVTLLENSGSADLLKNCEMELLVNGEEKFPRLWQALRAATQHIHAEYFIVKNDDTGREFAEILCERARAGVSVRLLYDDVGSWKLGRGYVRPLRDAGVEVRVSCPVSFPSLRSHMNFRNHRKIVVIDAEVAFSGGLNVGDEYCGRGPLGWWRDTHALYRGEAVAAFQKIFLEDWNACHGKPLDAKELCAPASKRVGLQKNGSLSMQLVATGSDSPWHSIAQAYSMMISSACQRIWITTPYLVPGSGILDALRIAAMSGVDVRILMPSVADHKLVFWAGRSNIEDLLRAGVRIWMYQEGFVHAKTLLTDGEVASVGTANLDTRSLEINYEVQAFIYSGRINGQLAELFERDCARSLECSLDEWVGRSIRQRVCEAGGRLWSSQV